MEPGRSFRRTDPVLLITNCVSESDGFLVHAACSRGEWLSPPAPSRGHFSSQRYEQVLFMRCGFWRPAVGSARWLRTPR